jgi:hypothetical protein
MAVPAVGGTMGGGSGSVTAGTNGIDFVVSDRL